MSPEKHSDKVAAEATKKKIESPYLCDNCGKTFESEREKREHVASKHGSTDDQSRS